MGTPFPGVEVAIYDPGTLSPLGVGETGEIWVRGPNVSPGYVGDAPLGLERHGAWLRTGDLAVRNAEGSFTFAGLRKAMFTRSGFNIYPRELELAVAELDGVHAARVSALPSPGREHEIAIEVTGRVTEAQVRAWCEERLSAYKQPSEVRVHVPDDERPRVTSAPA
jgi:acyl-CoA synthetase (AMP-forming)/AMP-acid ligase II